MQLKFETETDYKAYVENNSKDPYSRCVVDFGERWAALMENAIYSGEKLEEVADPLVKKADEGLGITGFQYGCAVQALAHFWIHGDALRVWHNKQYGVDEEKAQGGTVNPAILTIG